VRKGRKRQRWRVRKGEWEEDGERWIFHGYIGK
jgi:hypothetical protein